MKIVLYSAYVDLPEEVLRWVDAYAVKGDHPKTLVAAVQQLLAGSDESRVRTGSNFASA